MRVGQPIADKSISDKAVGDTPGDFLRIERMNVLTDNGWTLNRDTKKWEPPPNWNQRQSYGGKK